MKVVRISKYLNSCLVIFSETIILAKGSLIMLANVTFFWTLVLSVLVYVVEQDAPDHETFTSVFEAMYWCVVTQTTLGYGDINVVTPIGRMLACVTAVIGIVNLAFMINLVGSCFDEAYTRFLSREELDFYKRLEDEWNYKPDGETKKSWLLSDILENSDEGSDEYLMYSVAAYVAELNFNLIIMLEAPQYFSDPVRKSRLRALMANTRNSLDAELCAKDKT